MIRFFAGHPTAANLLMLLLLALGIATLPELRRETFPDFTPSELEVSVVYPGAGPEDVEEALCRPLEDAVEGVTFLEETRCEALEGRARLVVRMAEGGDFTTFISDVKSEIDAVDNLPAESEPPILRALGRRDTVVTVAITADTELTQLKTYTEGVKERMQRRPGIARVEIEGFSDRQVRIELKLPQLRRYGLSVGDVAAKVARQNVKLPAGNLETPEKTLLVRFDEQRITPQALARLVVAATPDGGTVHLGDIATLHERFELDEAKTLFNGKPAALLTVSKNKNQDALDVMAEVQRFLTAERARAPAGVHLDLARDATTIITDRLTMLVANGWQGLLLVFATMWLFFGGRYSFWVAMGLPVSFMGTLFVMGLLGLSINMLSMVALLMAIGILMDDAIVLSESIASHVEKGMNILDAAVAGVKRVGLGVFSSYLTTMAVFLGLAFIEGDIGKVLKVIPIVLLMTLTVSLVEAFLILPRHLVHSLEHARHRPQRALRVAFTARFERFRATTLVNTVERLVGIRYLFVGAVVALFFATLALPAGGLLKFSPFPNIDGDQVEARILLAPGTPLGRTEQVVDRVVEAARTLNRELSPEQPGGEALIDNLMVQYNTNKDANESGTHVATVSVDLLTVDRRTTDLQTFINRWRGAVGVIPGVLAITYKQPRFGPAGRPIEIRVQHDDLHEVAEASRRIQNWLRRVQGVDDVMDDLRLGKEELRLHLAPGAGSYGVDAETVASQLRAAFNNAIADEVQVGRETIEVDLRLALEDKDSITEFERFPIRLADGRSVPLATIAVIEPGRGYARIQRIDGRRTATIIASLDPERGNANQILNKLSKQLLPQVLAQHPGLEVSFQGSKKEGGKTAASIARAFLFGLFGIYLILSFQFRSYVEPVIVMVAIPLALIGVFWGHFLLGHELTMPSMLGFVSLAGIVVNDSILLVQFIKEHIRDGLPVHKAAVMASRERFRAILITSLTTAAGLLPLLFETSTQAQILIPLVISIVFGIATSTLLVLFVIPSLYCILEDLGWTSTVEQAGG
ncbi:efflux RND transporter permease subunit [Endothiovibrio diazotrophicus]